MLGYYATTPNHPPPDGEDLLEIGSPTDPDPRPFKVTHPLADYRRDSSLGVFPSMKSLTSLRGVAFAGALTLTHAATALGATSHAASTHAVTTHAVTTQAVTTQAKQSAAAQAAGTKALAKASGENTPLSLGHTVATHAGSSGGGGTSIVRTIVGLFIVIAVIYGIAWIMKQAKKSKIRPSGRGLTQVANLPLGSGRSVAVVRAGREILVVGVAENGVTPIRSYTEAEAIELGLEVPTEESENANPVVEKPLDRVLDGLRKMTARS